MSPDNRRGLPAHSVRGVTDPGRARLPLPTMSEPPNVTDGVSAPTPEAVVQLLDVVAEHSVDHALCDLEQLVTRLRADAVEAAQARHVLCTPVPVLRDALRLRAARIEAAR
jgi:hypothetical protein